MRGTSERAANALPATAPFRVLVVDPDSDARALYHTALPLAGCEVIEASDGRDALTKALVEPPSLIISELRLPLVDGYALCESCAEIRPLIPYLSSSSRQKPA